MRLVYCRFKSKKVEQVSYVIQFINSYLKYPNILYMIQHSRNLQIHFVFFIELPIHYSVTHRLNIPMGQK